MTLAETKRQDNDRGRRAEAAEFCASSVSSLRLIDLLTESPASAGLSYSGPV